MQSPDFSPQPYPLGHDLTFRVDGASPLSTNFAAAIRRELPRPVGRAARYAVRAALRECGDSSIRLDDITPEKLVERSIQRVLEKSDEFPSRKRLLMELFDDPEQLSVLLGNSLYKFRKSPEASAVALRLNLDLANQNNLTFMLDELGDNTFLGYVKMPRSVDVLQRLSAEDFCSFVRKAAFCECKMSEQRIAKLARSLHELARSKSVSSEELVEETLAGSVGKNKVDDESVGTAPNPFGLRLARQLIFTDHRPSAMAMHYAYRFLVSYSQAPTTELMQEKRELCRQIHGNRGYQFEQWLMQLVDSDDFDGLKQARVAEDLIAVTPPHRKEDKRQLLEHENLYVRLTAASNFLRGADARPGAVDLAVYASQKLLDDDIRPLAALAWYSSHNGREADAFRSVLSNVLITESDRDALALEFRKIMELQNLSPDHLPVYFRLAAVEGPLRWIADRQSNLNMRHNSLQLLAAVGAMGEGALREAFRHVAQTEVRRPGIRAMALLNLAGEPIEAYEFDSNVASKGHRALGWIESEELAGLLTTEVRQAAQEAIAGIILDTETINRISAEHAQREEFIRNGPALVITGRLRPEKFIIELKSGRFQAQKLFVQYMKGIESAFDFAADRPHVPGSSRFAQMLFREQSSAITGHILEQLEESPDATDEQKARRERLVQILSTFDKENLLRFFSETSRYYILKRGAFHASVMSSLVEISRESETQVANVCNYLLDHMDHLDRDAAQGINNFCREFCIAAEHFNSDTLTRLFQESAYVELSRLSAGLLMDHHPKAALEAFILVADSPRYSIEMKRLALELAAELDFPAVRRYLVGFINQDGDDALRGAGLSLAVKLNAENKAELARALAQDFKPFQGPAGRPNRLIGLAHLMYMARDHSSAREFLAETLSYFNLDEASIKELDEIVQAYGKKPMEKQPKEDYESDTLNNEFQKPRPTLTLSGLVKQIGIGKVLTWSMNFNEPILRENAQTLLGHYARKRSIQPMKYEMLKALYGLTQKGDPGDNENSFSDERAAVIIASN